MFNNPLHKFTLQKVTWQQVGHVSEPGRYLFTFGWLNVNDDDLAGWRQFPHAAFTLIADRMALPVEAGDEPTDEYRLGIFDLQPATTTDAAVQDDADVGEHDDAGVGHHLAPDDDLAGDDLVELRDDDDDDDDVVAWETEHDESPVIH